MRRGPGTGDRRPARPREGRSRLQGIVGPIPGRPNELITIENHAAKHLRIVPARLSELDFICSIQSADRGGMSVFSPKGTGEIPLSGPLVALDSLPSGRPPATSDPAALA